MNEPTAVSREGASVRSDFTVRVATRNHYILAVVAVLVLIFAIAFDRGFLARAFAARPLLKLGEWSYAIYMGQTFFLQLIRYFEQRFYPPPDTMIFGWRFADLIWWSEPFALLAVCVGWGALLAIFIEHPANAALRRMFARGKQVRA